MPFRKEDGTILYVFDIDDINDESTASGIGVFLGLTDTPSSYAGEGGCFVQVNKEETGLEFNGFIITKSAGLIFKNDGGFVQT